MDGLYADRRAVAVMKTGACHNLVFSRLLDEKKKRTEAAPSRGYLTGAGVGCLRTSVLTPQDRE